ncbi:TRIM5 [Cervus elaphus hippelaphus]|uniref:TRIM5 n=1 Tax=Cervus elaphus hippelaphus TaxID=46360 RepID=A0A212DI33_CEREH|nr:TRIM5 [Cervus elaphus hippelaphus]
MIKQKKECSCSVCRTSHELGNLRPNWHLANVSREVQRFQGEPGGAREKFLLFYEKDGKEHCSHHTFLMEEVVQKYQVRGQKRGKTGKKAGKLQESLQRLKWEQQKVEMLEDEIQEEISTWKTEEEAGLHNLADSENKLVQQNQFVSELISYMEHQLQRSTIEMMQDVNAIMKRSENFIAKPKTFSKEQKRISSS